jgi:hypothetical protein
MSAPAPGRPAARLPRTAPPAFVPAACLTAMIAVHFVAGFYPEAASEVNVTLGGLALLYGTWAFLAHGGGRITALGLFNYAFALFIGVGGINDGLDPQPQTAARWTTLAITLALIVQILVNLTAWTRVAAAPRHLTLPPAAHARRLTLAGGAGIVLVFVAQRLGLPYATDALADGTAFAAVALFAAGLILRDGTQLFSRQLLYALAAFSLYAGVFHQGTGRLRVVALACAIGLLMTARWPHRGIKWATVAATPGALILLALDRLALQESLQPGASEGRTGLESMMSPIRVFAQVIEAISGRGTVDPSWGQSFLSVPFILVPESAHPGWVPPALGYELVMLVNPSRVGSGYSVVSTVYGEMYWAASWLGLILAVPLLALLVGALDARFRQALDELTERPQAMVRAVFWAMLAGGIADLVWSGTHTWLARHLTRLPMLLLVAVLVWFATRPPKPPTVVERRAAEVRRQVAHLPPVAGSV